MRWIDTGSSRGNAVIQFTGFFILRAAGARALLKDRRRARDRRSLEMFINRELEYLNVHLEFLLVVPK